MMQNKFERRVLFMTISCALGLLLHCAFILYLSVTFDDNIAIIILMMVLSEIVPLGIFLILLQRSDRHRVAN